MFQSESDDMTPRCVPSPCGLGVDVATIQPSVPEVSILVGHTESPQPLSNVFAEPSYAAWKKQCLPPVKYGTPEIFVSEIPCKSASSSVFPLRAVNKMLPTSSVQSSAFAAPRYRTECCHSENKENRTTECSPTFTANASVTSNCNLRRVSEPIFFKKAGSITSCVGTQTENFPVTENCKTQSECQALKEDIAEIKSILVQMQSQQLILMNALNQLQVENKKFKDVSRLTDVGTQYEQQHTSGQVLNKQSKTKYNSTKEETCTHQKATGYIDQVASGVQRQPCQQPENKRLDVVSGLPKPSNDQSMIMNDLALKYLPAEQLKDLLQDLHMSNMATHVHNAYELPSRIKENFGKHSTDLSQASYKYLNKYRLLPEENNRLTQPEDNLLDLETIRRQPKLM